MPETAEDDPGRLWFPSAVGAGQPPSEFFGFEVQIDQILFVSATPAEYEEEHEMLRAEQVIRPTGLLDPGGEVRPIEGTDR